MQRATLAWARASRDIRRRGLSSPVSIVCRRLRRRDNAARGPRQRFVRGQDQSVGADHLGEAIRMGWPDVVERRQHGLFDCHCARGRSSHRGRVERNHHPRVDGLDRAGKQPPAVRCAPPKRGRFGRVGHGVRGNLRHRPPPRDGRFATAYLHRRPVLFGRRGVGHGNRRHVPRRL